MTMLIMPMEVTSQAPAEQAGQKTGEGDDLNFFALVMALIAPAEVDGGVSPMQGQLPPVQFVEGGAAVQIPSATAAQGGQPAIVPGTVLNVLFQSAPQDAVGELLLGQNMAQLESALSGWSESPAGEAELRIDSAGYGSPSGEVIVVESNMPADQASQVFLPSQPGGGVDPGRIVLQLVRATEAGARRNVEKLRVRLYPPSLGRIEVTLSVTDGRISAGIRVENEAVRQLIESNLGQLRDSLVAAGLDVAGFDVYSQDKRFETMPRGGRRFSGRGFSLEGIADEHEGELAVRLAWPWSTINTVA